MAGLEAPTKPRPLPKPPTSSESKGRARFNFLAASERDSVVFGAERPGQAKPNPEAPSTPRGPQVPSIIVDQWSAHMRSKGIKRVVCVLNESELGFYEGSMINCLRRHFDGENEGGGPRSSESSKVQHIIPHAETAMSDISTFLNDSVEKNEPVVVFCSTGQARTGMILAYWLHYKVYNILTVIIPIRQLKLSPLFYIFISMLYPSQLQSQK